MEDIRNKINELANEGCYINKLAWVMAMSESDGLKSMLRDMTYDDFADIGIKDTVPDETDDIIELLFCLDKVGFLAECHHQEQRNIKFDKKGNFASCLISGSCCTVFYVYADSVEELIGSIMVENEKLSRKEIEAAKKHLMKNNSL